MEDKFLPLLLAVASFFCVSEAGDVRGTFCRNQLRRYKAAVEQIDNAMRVQAPETEMCRIMVNYAQTAYDTNATCQHAAEATIGTDFHQLWSHMEENIRNICQGFSLPRQCSYELPMRLKTRCVRQINSYNAESSMEEICRESQDFLDCLKDIALICNGMPDLVSKEIIWTISGTQTTMTDYCSASQPTAVSATDSNDSMQGDAPEGNQCTDDKAINPMLMNCLQARALEDSVNDVCEMKHVRIICMERATVSVCRSALDESILAATRADYHKSCRILRNSCPEIVQNKTVSAIGFCYMQLNQEISGCGLQREQLNCLTSLLAHCDFTNLREKASMQSLIDTVTQIIHSQCS